MIRYDAIIGVMVLGDTEFPVLTCEIIAEDRNYAEFLMEFRGFRIFELQETNKIPAFEPYQLN